MARTPTDATRFTATTPYASSPTSFASHAPTTGSQLSFGGNFSAPTGETPQQKIARLRAAAAATKLGKETSFETTVRIGRRWADRAHRVTAVGLIGLTVVSGAVATAGITDMLLHNRRRRNEWLAEQQAKSARDLAEARRAQEGGAATEDQVLLINRERAAEEAAEAKRRRPGVLKRATGWVFGGLSAEEQKGGRLGAAAAGAGAALKEAGEKSTEVVRGVQEEVFGGQQHDRTVLQAVGEKVEGNRRQVEKAQEVVKPLGGPLDREAQLAADAMAGNRSWTSWIMGR